MVLNTLVIRSPPLGRAIPAPGLVVDTFTLAAVLALSLLGRVLASLALLSLTMRSSSLTRRLSASFSRFTESSSSRCKAVSSYRDVAGNIEGDMTSVLPLPGVACAVEEAGPPVPGGERRLK